MTDLSPCSAWFIGWNVGSFKQALSYTSNFVWQFYMKSFLARVDGVPDSLSSFSLSSTFARLNDQHVSLTTFYCPIDQWYFKEWEQWKQWKGTVWAWVKLVKFICQGIYTSNVSYGNLLYDKYTCSKAGMLGFEKVYLSQKNYHMVLSTRTDKKLS